MKPVKSLPPVRVGDEVVIREQGITERRGQVRAVKWSPPSGWWVDVAIGDNAVWVVKASDVEVQS